MFLKQHIFQVQFVVVVFHMCIHIDVDTCAINSPTSSIFIARPRCPSWLWVACRRCGRWGGGFTSHTQNPSLKIKKLKIDNVGWHTWQTPVFFWLASYVNFWVWYLVRLVVCLEGIRCCNTKLPDALIPGNRTCVIFPRSTWAWNLYKDIYICI